MATLITNCQNKTEFVLDDEDLERISKFKWYDANGSIERTIMLPNLAYRGGFECFHISLAKEIMQDISSVFDHKDRNYKNNKKYNLRPCTHEQNSWNKGKMYSGTTSKYIGVNKRGSKFRAYITHKRKHITIGTFSTEKEAVEAYNKKALELRGEFAVLNVFEVLQ